MKVAVFGLGYVGCTMMGCLSRLGHRVAGVDLNLGKVKAINSGQATVYEPGLQDLVSEGHSKKLLSATDKTEAALAGADVAFICVGTPNSASGDLDVSQLLEVAGEIGEHLKQRASYLTVVIRSTVPVGTNQAIARVISERSGKESVVDFGVASNPEFLREGSAISDFFHPPYSLVGTESPDSFALLESLYQGVGGDTILVSVGTAELIKFVNNSFHALKVSFANEVGRISEGSGVDASELANIFLLDTKLNVSGAYLRPGFAYGGSCLPKDLLGLNSIARQGNVSVPILNSIESSNLEHIEFVAQKVVGMQINKVGLLGIAFKSNTDDVRNSPAIELGRKLTREGVEVRFFDSKVSQAVNRGFLQADLLDSAGQQVSSVNALIEGSELVVVVNRDDSFLDALQMSGDSLSDKVVLMLFEEDRDFGFSYESLV